MTPKGQMSSNGSGPAIMMMKPHIRATFMPDPPLRYLPPPKKGGSSRRPNHSGKTMVMMSTNSTKTTKQTKGDKGNHKDDADMKKEDENGTKVPNLKTSSLGGVSDLMIQFERSKPPKRKLGSTPASAKQLRHKRKVKENANKLAPLIEEYQNRQKEHAGEFEGMNCYNTLFVGRLAYETTERKLLREFETYGPVKDLKLILKRSGTADSNGDTSLGLGMSSKNKTDDSRGYAFVEFENEEDMKRAYRGADGKRLDGKEIVVDVERGHTVPNWLPRRLGGGLGGTRLGGKDKNITAPGRFDPSKQQPPPPHHFHPNNHPNMHPMNHGPPFGHGHHGPPGHHGHGGGRAGGPMMPPRDRGGRGGGPPPGYHPHHPPMGGWGGGGGGGPPPPGHRYGGGGGGYHGGGGRQGDRGLGGYGGGPGGGPPRRRGPPDWDRHGPPGGPYGGGGPGGGGGRFDRNGSNRGGNNNHPGKKRQRSRSNSPSRQRRFR